MKGNQEINKREIFLKIAHFEMPGKVFIPSYLQGFWKATIERWRKEGLPSDVDLSEYFGFDRTELLLINPEEPFPSFEEKTLERDGESEVIIDRDGSKKRILTDGREESMDQWLEYPVKDRKTWSEYKKRLDPNSPARFPCCWNEGKEKYKKRNYPLGIYVGGFWSCIRRWVGIENLSYIMAENFSLIEEMEEHVEYFVLSILEKVLRDIQIDFAQFGEDMAYKSGSLVSPSFVRKHMVPHYKKITKFLHSNGVDTIILDSDGNIWELISLWLECGINGVFPNEVAAGMDIVEMRKKFGKDLIIIGGIDKRVLTRSKEEIEKEVKRKAGDLIKDSGYFPAIDHAVPPNVPFDNYLHYLNVVRNL